MDSEIKKIIPFIKHEALVDKIENLTKDDVNQIRKRENKLTLSLVMLVKNQETVIQEVLSRIRRLNLNEYHVIDTGSTDTTPQILKSLDYVSFHSLDWVEDYGKMRNLAVKFTTADWVLVIDSDELLMDMNINLKLLIATLEKVCDDNFAISFEAHSPHKSRYEIPTRLYNPKKSSYFGLVHEELRDKWSLEPVNSVLTRIKTENLGTTEKEVKKFSKEERYFELSKQMMKIEPENPRWFALSMTNYAIRRFIEQNNYETFLNKYLFKNKEYDLSIANINKNNYAKMILEQYVALFIAKGKLKEAEELAEVGLKIYPKDIFLVSCRSVTQVEQIRIQIKRLLKENLGLYLSIDKQENYDLNCQDTQLYEVTLAELNMMIGNLSMAKQIVETLTDENVKSIWRMWNRSERRK